MFLGPWFVGGGGIPDFGHAFSNYTYFLPCGRFSLISVQRPRRLGCEKKKERRRNIGKILSPPTYYVGRPKNIEHTKIRSSQNPQVSAIGAISLQMSNTHVDQSNILTLMSGNVFSRINRSIKAHQQLIKVIQYVSTEVKSVPEVNVVDVTMTTRCHWIFKSPQKCAPACSELTYFRFRKRVPSCRYRIR